MPRYSHKNSRKRRPGTKSRKSKSPRKTSGGGYAFDLDLPPIGGMAQVIAYNDYLFGGGKGSTRTSRKKTSSKKKK